MRRQLQNKNMLLTIYRNTSLKSDNVEDIGEIINSLMIEAEVTK